MLFICSGSPLLGYAIHIKAAEFNVSALQSSQHCYKFRSFEVGVTEFLDK